MKRIGSRDNALFKRVRALVDDHRAPRRLGEALAEGVHLVSTCLEFGADIRQLIVSESGLADSQIMRLASRCATAPIVFSDSLFRLATGIASPVGIAVVVGIASPPPAAPGGDALLLDAVQDAGNVGTLLRTAAAAGITDVFLGTGCAGAWTARVLRAGQGAHFSLRIREQVNLESALATFSAPSIATVARDGVPLFDIDLCQPVVWLVGNEGAGLSPALIAAASRRATIPLADGAESLNVAAAAAICMFEAVRQRRLASAEFCALASGQRQP